MSNDSEITPTHEPEAIQPRPNNPTPNPMIPLMNAITTAAESLIPSGSMSAIPRDIDYHDLSQEEKGIVDAFMEQIKPEIEFKAKELLAAEIRDRIVRKVDLSQLRKQLIKRKSVSLKRKKGCIYVQFGTGEPWDEIQEFLVAST